jgi:hypothetical protein
MEFSLILQFYYILLTKKEIRLNRTNFAYGIKLKNLDTKLQQLS